jgi:hypothetical protein
MAVPALTDHATSVRGYAMRVSSLSVSGAPLTGTSGSVWVSGQFLNVTFTPENEAGEDIANKAADGSLCQILKTPDILKYYNVHLEICNPEPELIVLLGGGTTFTNPGSSPVTGYQSLQAGQLTTSGVGNGVGIEVWSGAYVNGKPASTNPYWVHAFPLCTLTLTGDRVIENGFIATVFEGYCFGNANFFPGGGTPVLQIPTDKPYQSDRVAALPTILNGFTS